MGIRQAVNENPIITIAATILLTLVALIYIVTHMGNKPTTATFPTKSYYSDDDGKTWYLDDATNVPPYQHNGKEAARAILFRCGGKPFIARLEQFDEQAKAKIEEQMHTGANPLAAQYYFASRGMMVKRPGDAKWVKLQEGDLDSARAFGKVMEPRCPDGSSNPQPIGPDEKVLPE